MKKLVIFDMDGTILDSMKVWKEEGIKLLSQSHVPGVDIVIKKFNLMSAYEVAKYVAEKGETVASKDDLINKWRSNMLERYLSDIETKPHVKEMLQMYRNKGYRLVLASGTPQHIARAALTRLDLIDYFAAVYDEIIIDKSKKNPEFFSQIMEQEGYSPEQTIVIDDAVFAIKAAHNSGAYTIAIYDDLSKDLKEEIMAYADQYIYDYSELLA